MVEQQSYKCYDCGHDETGSNLLPEFQTQKTVTV
jgi:hypothetical protein